MQKVICLAVILATQLPGLCLADEDESAQGQQALLEARRTGQIMPLATILTQIHDITGDEIVYVEFEREGGLFKYGIYYLDPHGHRREVYVDARTGEVLEIGLPD